MNFNEHIITDYDEIFKKIVGIKWIPWFGKHYYRTKTIVLGESQYEDGDEWQDDNIDATRILIEKRLSGSKGILYTNVEKVLLSINNPSKFESNLLWSSIIYWNLVPRLMSNRNERPGHADYDNGWKLFFNIIKTIQPQPTTCIVLGKSSCGRLGYYLNNNTTEWEKNSTEFYASEKIINLTNNGNKLKLIFINHPSGSRGFDYKFWTRHIAENAPNLQNVLMIENKSS